MELRIGESTMANLPPHQLVRVLRQRKRWLLKDLSTHTGIHVSDLSRIENAKVEIGLDRAIKLAEAFGRSPKCFITKLS